MSMQRSGHTVTFSAINRHRPSLVSIASLVCLLLFFFWSPARAFAEYNAWRLICANEATAVYHWESTCNSYLIKRGDRAILIDLGDGSAVEKAHELGVQHIDWVLATSHHRERSQGYWSVDHSRFKFAGPTKERDFFEQPSSFRKWHPSLGDPFSVYGASYLRPPRMPIKLDHGMEQDEILNWEGIEIRGWETPGNSPGGMTYLLQVGDKHLAFSGGVIHAGAKLVNWFDTEWDYGFAKGIDTLIGSVQRLQSESLDILLPVHGPPIEQPITELKRYQEKLEQFRARYIRGYPVFEMTNQQRDPVSVPTEVPGLSQVSPHVYKLSDSQKGWNFAIIISDRGHGLILDCGLLPAEMLEQLIVGMRQHLGLKQIDAFWISHMHGDHFLLGPLLRNRYGAQSWTLDRVVDPIEHPRRYDYAALISAYGDGFDGLPIDKSFRDGEIVDWEGYQIQVDWMPGQTEFGCSLWLEIDGQKIVFTGDNLFGNPADPNQDGHEAVVARNSCIFEEGYLHAANYLLELNPDVIIGSHSFVMPQPRAFLERYRNWAAEMIEIYRELLPDVNYEYRFDPYWVSAYPYRVDLTDEPQKVEIIVRNFRAQSQSHHIVFEPPPGIVIDPPSLQGTVAAKSRERFPVTIRRVNATTEPEVGIVAMDVTLDEQHYGQWFDFLIR